MSHSMKPMLTLTHDFTPIAANIKKIADFPTYFTYYMQFFAAISPILIAVKFE